MKMKSSTAEAKITYIVIGEPPKEVLFKGPRARKSVETSLVLSLPYLLFSVKIWWLGPLLFLGFFLTQLLLLYDYPKIPLILVVPRTLFSRLLQIPFLGWIYRVLLKTYDFLFHHGWFVVRREEPRYAAEEIFYFCLDKERSGHGLLFFLFYENCIDYAVSLSSWLREYYPGSRVILVSSKGALIRASELWKRGVLFFPLDPKKFKGFGEEYRWKRFWVLAEAVVRSDQGAKPIRKAVEGKKYVQLAAPPFSIGGSSARDMEGALRDVEAPLDRYMDFRPVGSVKAVRFVRLPKDHQEALHNRVSSPVEDRTGSRPDVYKYEPEESMLSPLRKDPLNVLVFCSESVEELNPACSLFMEFVEVRDGGEHISGLGTDDFRVVMETDTEVEVIQVVEVAKHDIILALDVSSSMGGQKLKGLKQASMEFINKLGMNVGLVAFQEKVRLKLPPGDPKSVKEAIWSLNAGGRTDIGKGISSALDLIEGSGTILLITDGRGPVSEEVLKRAKEMGVRVFCISIGKDADLSKLKNISSKTGGELYSAPEIQDLFEMYDKIASKMARGYLVKWIALGRTPEEVNASILAIVGGEDKIVFRGKVRRFEGPRVP
ncbi:MAG TPA: VWA domain-containing protein [Candidatus Korarchaeota archaeon]|nr:VWA domain-containing protein [Candidatus Korarchaeota archaeon]